MSAAPKREKSWEDFLREQEWWSPKGWKFVPNVGTESWKVLVTSKGALALYEFWPGAGYRKLATVIEGNMYTFHGNELTVDQMRALLKSHDEEQERNA